MVKNRDRRLAKFFVLISLCAVLGLLAGFFLSGDSDIISPPAESRRTPFVSSRMPMPPRPPSQESVENQKEDLLQDQQQVVPAKQDGDGIAQTSSSAEMNNYTVTIGPFMTERVLDQCQDLLVDLGIEMRRIEGEGVVAMIRLREGVYPTEVARQKLADLKEESEAAFLLPQEDKQALYLGSFFEHRRARIEHQALSKKGIMTEPVLVEIPFEGTLLEITGVDEGQISRIKEAVAGLEAGLTVLQQKESERGPTE